MRIEQYQDKYHDDALALIEVFFKDYVHIFDPDYIQASIEKTVAGFNHENGFLLVNDEDKAVGVLAGVELQAKHNEKRMFEEVAWYVTPEFGKYGFWFIAEVEKKLKQMGFDMLIMAVLDSPKANRIKKIYEAIGFKYLESHFVKAL